jgi:hypothetical protein
VEDAAQTAEGERVPAPPGGCWFCGEPAMCGQKLAGRRRRVRGLCSRHADAVFGPADPPWQRLDAKPMRETVHEWMAGLTIVSHAAGRAPQELHAEIAKVNQPETVRLELVTPLLPGELRTLNETVRAVQQLRSRETSVHLLVTALLVGWLAEATEQSRSDVLQRLSLTLESVLLPPGENPPQPG